MNYIIQDYKSEGIIDNDNFVESSNFRKDYANLLDNSEYNNNEISVKSNKIRVL